MSFFKGFLYPIHDVTTSPTLEFSAIASLHPGKSLTYTETSAYRQAKVHPDLEPLHSAHPPHELFSQAVLAAKLVSQWDLVFINASCFQLEAVVGKRPFFQADIVLEVRKSGAGSCLHMRSRSRHGLRDLGANAKRIRDFFDAVSKLETALNQRI